MRFLAVQDDGYGVGLVESRVPSNADDSMMAATGEAEADEVPKVEEGSMISNLPLLFADGYPTSLDKITLKQLERFITFMVQCSLGHDTAEVISEPQWWPKEVKFSNPLTRPKKINESWMANLKKLVFRCYTYHRCEYLLRFCAYLAQYSRDKLYYVNNWDSTTSLYHKGTGKLLVTFRNENMNYDKGVESPRRSLLPQYGSSSNAANKTRQQQQQQQSSSLVVIQPPSDEIYLCDNCDAEFVGLEKMKEHEKTCGDQEQTTTTSRPQTPNETVVQPVLAQNQFLEYFNLYTEAPAKPPESANSATFCPVLLPSNRTSRRVRGSVNLTRCPTIPFSSPAGIAMAKKTKMMNEVTQQERLERIERHLHAPALGKSQRPKWLDRFVEYSRWVVTYKPNRDKQATEDTLEQYTHTYQINGRKGKPALSIRSQLLYIACRPCYVVLQRQSPAALEELARDPSKYCPPVRRITPRTRPRTLAKVRQAQQSPSLLQKRKLSTEKLTTDLSPKIIQSTNEIPSAFLHPPEDAQSFEASDDLAVITVIKHSPIQPRPKTPRNEPARKILIVDLCSSDEESEISAPPASSDENIDPMRLNVNTNGRATFTKNVALNKFRTRPCVHPADSTSDWLRDNVLTDDNDKCANKC